MDRKENVMTKLMSFAGIALKNLISKPVTSEYPAVPKVYPERTRGHVEIQIEDCLMCGMCMRNCPPGAIKVDRAKGTWDIQRFDCIQCGYCVENCPQKCLKMVPGYQTPAGQKEAEEYVKPPAPKPAMPKPVMPKTATAESQSQSAKLGEQQVADGHVAVTVEKEDQIAKQGA